MKHILTSLCLMVFFIDTAFSQGFHPVSSHVTSQNDTSFWSNASIKINPLRILSGLIGGEEYGGIVQFPLIRKSIPFGSYYKVDAYIGGGLNQYFGVQSPEGKFPLGYTIRAGIYYFFNKEREGYLSLQYFFRKWSLNNIVEYTTGTNTIFSPYSLIGGEQGDLDDRYNASVNVNCYDLVYGDQISLSESGRIILDWYVGFGRRIKNIQQTIIGDYDGSNYIPRAVPYSYPDEIDKYIDIKLGFMIGFTL